MSNGKTFEVFDEACRYYFDMSGSQLVSLFRRVQPAEAEEATSGTAKALGPEELEFRVGWIRECLKAQPDTMCLEFLEDLRRLALERVSG